MKAKEHHHSLGLSVWATPRKFIIWQGHVLIFFAVRRIIKQCIFELFIYRPHRYIVRYNFYITWGAVIFTFNGSFTRPRHIQIQNTKAFIFLIIKPQISCNCKISPWDKLSTPKTLVLPLFCLFELATFLAVEEDLSLLFDGFPLSFIESQGLVLPGPLVLFFAFEISGVTTSLFLFPDVLDWFFLLQGASSDSKPEIEHGRTPSWSEPPKERPSSLPS